MSYSVELTSFNSNKKQLNFFSFCRFSWLANYIRFLRFGLNVFLITLEPFTEDESLKLCFYKGSFVSSSFNLNSLSVVLRQTFNGIVVDRTFFLNSSNCVYIKKV